MRPFGITVSEADHVPRDFSHPALLTKIDDALPLNPVRLAFMRRSVAHRRNEGAPERGAEEALARIDLKRHGRITAVAFLCSTAIPTGPGGEPNARALQRDPALLEATEPPATSLGAPWPCPQRSARRLVSVIVSLAYDAERLVADVDRVSRLPVGNGSALSVGGSAGSPSTVSNLNRYPEPSDLPSVSVGVGRQKRAYR